MSTFTAQELADFYQKVADGGEAEYKVHTKGVWITAACGPSLLCLTKQYRIKPTKKVIDLKLVDARASYEAARAIDWANYAAALDAAFIDSLFAAAKE